MEQGMRMRKKIIIAIIITVAVMILTGLEFLCGYYVPYSYISFEDRQQDDIGVSEVTEFRHEGFITRCTVTRFSSFSGKASQKNYIIPNISFYLYSWLSVKSQNLEAIDGQDMTMGGNSYSYTIIRLTASELYASEDRFANEVIITARKGAYTGITDIAGMVRGAHHMIRIPDFVAQRQSNSTMYFPDRRKVLFENENYHPKD